MDRRLAEGRDGAGSGVDRHVHDVSRVIDDRRDRQDLGERAPLFAESIHDAGLGGANVGRGRRIARLEADDALRQLGFREFHAERVDNADRAKLEQGAGVDLDDDRGGRAIAISLRGAREGRDVARSDRQACAVDRDRHRGVVIACAPERIDDRREIALRASRKGFAIGRGVLAQAVERGSVPRRALERAVVACDLDGQRIGNARPGNRRRRIVRAEEPKEIKSLSGGPIAHNDRAGNQRDDKTQAETITLFRETLASQLNSLFPD